MKKSFVFDLVDVSEMTLGHNLGKGVFVSAFDSNGEKVSIDWEYTFGFEHTKVTVFSNPPFTGKIICT